MVLPLETAREANSELPRPSRNALRGRKTSFSESPLQFAGYRVIARPTGEARNEIGSAVRIIPDEGVNIIIAACRTRCERVIAVIHLFFPFLVHLALTRTDGVATHENSGAELKWPLRWQARLILRGERKGTSWRAA